MVRDPIDAPHKDPEIDEGGIHLFKHAPRGIVFDYIGKSISSYSLVAFGETMQMVNYRRKEARTVHKGQKKKKQRTVHKEFKCVLALCIPKF